MSGGSRDDVGRFTVSCTSIQFLCLIFLVSCPIFVDKCNIDSIGLFNIARYTAGMPHLATLEMASHWILGRYAPKNPVRLHILPSALPPKGEARRYAANDFLNLIELPRGEGCDARIPSSKKAAKPPPYNKAPSTSVGMTFKEDG